MKSQKITKEALPARRSYEDACGAAHALDLVGERWALLVMRELLLGPKRFSDLKNDLPGISANVLTQRLEGLEAAGIVVRRKLPPPASAQVYELTPWGYESEPIFQVLGRWAARSPQHDPTLPLSAVSLLTSFRTMIDPVRAKGFKARVGLRIGDETFLARVTNGAIEVARGELDNAGRGLHRPGTRDGRCRLWRAASRRAHPGRGSRGRGRPRDGRALRDPVRPTPESGCHRLTARP
jgi:DNA-binding HxlR family transcriptional regulator